MEATIGATTTPLGEPDLAAWLDLFDRLNMTLASTAGPEARRLLRGLGPRRHEHAHLRLLRERERLIAELENLGVGSIEGRTAPSGEVALHESLDDDYVKLADAFVNCALLANRAGNISLTRWLLERARMHRQQAQFLLM